MLSFYFRSSSINDFFSCPLKHYLTYVLNFKFAPHHSADLGTATHKSLEILGLWKLAQQEDKYEFYEEEIDKIYKTNDFKVINALDDAIVYYLKKKILFPEDVPNCTEWFWKAVNDYTAWTPLGNKVKMVEKHFDFELKQPWAAYEYKVGNEVYKGNLSLRGTVDLIFDSGPNSMEVVDYKTGRTSNDFTTGKAKNSVNLLDDFQMQLYYYALNNEFPEMDHIMMTLLFIRAGGPFTPPFEKSHLPKIENRIKTVFEEIKNMKKVPNIKKDYKQNYRCRFCPFSKEKFENTGQTYCDYFEKEIKETGLSNVDKKHFNPATIKEYSGGGRTVR